MTTESLDSLRKSLEIQKKSKLHTLKDAKISTTVSHILISIIREISETKLILKYNNYDHL